MAERKNKVALTKMEDSSYHESREKWSHKIEYTLSMIGYCVGPGNIWRFPYICARNGGGAFLLPFLFFLVVWGLPLFFLEVSLGQFMGKGIINAWDACPLFKGIGLGMVLLNMILCFYFNTTMAWILYYLVNSFFYPLPWSTCDNDWNTARCSSDRFISSNGTSQFYGESNCTNCTHVRYNVDSDNESQPVTSEEEFWQHKVLQMSSGIEEIGNFPWHLPVCLLTAWIILYLCVIKGIRSVGKVVFVTATLPYIILLVLIIRGLTLPGGVDGIIYYLKPDFNRLLDTKVWVEAALQVFFSLGPCWGGLIILASYNKFNNNCLRDAVFLTIFNEGTSIFAGLAVFSVLGYMAQETNLSIGKVVKSGPGLGFMAYPEAIAQLPLSNLWAVLFFVMLLTATLDCLFANLEIISSALMDTFTSLRKRKAVVIAIVSCVSFLAQLPLCTQGGIYIFQLVDWYIGANAVFIFGFLECIIFGWIYGIEMFSRDVALMIGRPIPMLLRICICFVTPAVLVVLFIVTLSTYKPPTYGSYHYPGYAEIIGWIIASLPLIPVIAFFIIELRKSKGDTFLQRFKTALRPSSKWKPNSDAVNSVYDNEDREYKVPFLRKIKLNILGDDYNTKYTPPEKSGIDYNHSLKIVKS